MPRFYIKYALSVLKSDIVQDAYGSFWKFIEKRTWQDILVKAKKENHGIDVNDLNKCARDRLVELRIEAESLISLRYNGKSRLYGYIIDGMFVILWYDCNHGDNNTCVCRSRLKHT